MPAGYDQVDGGQKGSNGPVIGAAICGGLIVVIIWGVLPYVLGTMIGYGAFIAKPTGVFEYIFQDPPLTPETIPKAIWYPGCTDKPGVTKNATYLAKCSKSCFSPDLIPAIDAFNKKHLFKKVSYQSRKDTEGKTYTLRGWLLQGDKSNLPKGATAPRVAMNHGFTSNSNKWYLTVAAYYMRSMGFDVLVNNIRGVGYSDNTSNPITSWGNAYHYDLLGAWDYLKENPDNHLQGGKAPSSKVGIMGFSMGAFITINAFTLEPEVPAAWADSPPASAASVFFFGAEKNPAAPIFKIPGVSSLSWFWMTNKAGVDISVREPLKDIPENLDKITKARPIKLVINLPDNTVPSSDVKAIEGLLKKYPDAYDTNHFVTNGVCNKETHLVSMLLDPAKYRKDLCDFWTAALDAPKTMCGLDKLAKFEVAKERRLAAEEMPETRSFTV